MIASGDDWMSGAGTLQAAVVAAPAVPVQPVDGGQGSFADAMQATLPPVSVEAAVTPRPVGTPVQSESQVAGAGDSSNDPTQSTTKDSCGEDAVVSGQTIEEGPTVETAQKANVAKLAHHAIAIKMPGDAQTKIKAAVAKPTKHVETKATQAVAADAAVEVKSSGGGVETAQLAAPIAVTTQNATSALADKGADAGNAGAEPVVAGDAVATSTSAVAASALADAATSVAVAQAADAVVAKVAVQGSIAETSPSVLGAGMQVAATPVQGLLPVNAANNSTHSGAAGLMNASHAGHSGETSELTLHTYDASTPNQLEVGLHGGAFGWLKVRAEMGQDGEVNAYLRGSSVNSTELLQAQAPGIAAYLGAQEVAVRSVQVEVASTAYSASGAGVASDGSSGGAGPQQEQRGGKDSGYNGALEVDPANDEWMGGGVLPPQMYAGQSNGTLTGTGGWVNIQA